MLAPVHRVRSWIAIRGESFSIGGVSRRGIFGVLTRAEARVYTPEAVLDAAGTPLYGIMVRDDDSISVSQTVVWAGLSLTVHSVVPRRMFGQTLFKVAVVS